jgi:transcriptional regulator with XRE-family HTH domain
VTPREKESRQTLVRRVLQESGLPRTVIASDSGLSRAALEAWVSAKRNPEPESLHQLSAGLQRRAEELARLAGELDAAAKREG